MMDDRAKGVAVLARLLGDDRAAAVRDRFAGLSPAFEAEALSVVFGRTWGRDTLDTRTRALCSICILSALGRRSALGINLDIALANGIDRAEIVEALLQVAIYAGYPAALDALVALEEAEARA
ncbi:MAG: carboxymuconolactone decarboxylase family protein [Pseudomonadota bacterium]